MNHLELHDFRFGHLGPVSLSIEGNRCACIFGASGAGKTLLMRGIADLDEHSGILTLDGRDYRDIPAPQWRRRVGFLPVESGWWDEVVGVHFNGVAVDQLRTLGFEKDVMEWQVRRLSSGERQRLALLRLLANQPGVVLLDEPTANLDPVNAQRVETLLCDYKARVGAAMLWVSHDREQIERVADFYFEMSHGQLHR